jgi:hypothetical protein
MMGKAELCSSHDNHSERSSAARENSLHSYLLKGLTTQLTKNLKYVIRLIAIALEFAILFIMIIIDCSFPPSSELLFFSVNSKFPLGYLFIALKTNYDNPHRDALNPFERCLSTLDDVRRQKTITKSPYYYTILSNKYVVNDDDTH